MITVVHRKGLTIEQLRAAIAKAEADKAPAEYVEMLKTILEIREGQHD